MINLKHPIQHLYTCTYEYRNTVAQFGTKDNVYAIQFRWVPTLQIDFYDDEMLMNKNWHKNIENCWDLNLESVIKSIQN